MLSAIYLAWQICAPAAMVEMVNKEVELITLHIHNRLNEEEGDDNFI